MIAETIQTRADLQRICRERAASAGQARTWIVSATMDTLRDYAGGGELPSVPVPAAGGVNLLADAIRAAAVEAVTDLVGDAVADRLTAIEERLGTVTRPTVISIAGRPAVTINRRIHAALAEVLECLAANVEVFLVGPAGSGKTQLAADAAEAFGAPFGLTPLSGGATESSILGSVSPLDGRYTPSSFSAMYAAGGVHLLDEIDGADPNMLLTVNGAISNHHLSIPRAGLRIDKHADFRLIAAANTYGNGPDAVYVGREQLDAATLDRFTMGRVFVDYDLEIDKAVVAAAGIGEVGEDLLTWAWSVRDAIGQHKLRRIMSTRIISKAAARIAAGGTLEQLKRTYFLSWTADEKRRIDNA